MTGPDERLSRTARGWDEAADGYRAYFVAPLRALGEGCCRGGGRGARRAHPGAVLRDLPRARPARPTVPGRAIVGIDLSAEMVRLARGDAFIAELRKQYVDQAPPGEWVHHPHARLLAVRKATSAD